MNERDPDELELDDIRQWAVEGGELYFPAGQVEKRLPSGQYDIAENMRGVFFRPHASENDDLIRLPDTQSDKILSYVKDFWTREEYFRKYGYLWKRGILLYGPPGSGKTSTINLVCDHIAETGGVVVYVKEPLTAIHGLELFRTIEPTRPLVVIIEDIDHLMRMEGPLLALLDGEHQIDNVMFIATTNHPERLPPRLVNRPSRFDVVEQIGMPNAAARRVYITTVAERANDPLDNVDELVQKTEGMSVAHIKDVIISIRVFGLDVDDAVARMRTMMDGVFIPDDVREEDCDPASDRGEIFELGNVPVMVDAAQ